MVSTPRLHSLPEARWLLFFSPRLHSLPDTPPPTLPPSCPALPPEDLQALHRYLVLWRERPSWRESHFDEGLAVGPWQRMAEAAQVRSAGSPCE